MSVMIPLSKGYFAQIDDGDVEIISNYNWAARVYRGKWVYAQATRQRNKKRVVISMHRLVMGASRGQLVDHANGDTLDNRRRNLRFATSSQNQQNRHYGRGISRFKGVSPLDYNCWQATIRKNGQQIYLGFFRVEEDAARAYDRAARELFGDFANVNFSDEIHSRS